MTLPAGTVTFLFTDIEGSTQLEGYLDEIERAFKGTAKPSKVPGAGLISTVVGLVEPVLLVAAIVVIVLLIRWAF